MLDSQKSTPVPSLPTSELTFLHLQYQNSTLMSEGSFYNASEGQVQDNKATQTNTRAGIFNAQPAAHALRHNATHDYTGNITVTDPLAVEVFKPPFIDALFPSRGPPA